jgi:imidazolonepropionase-like amidohydrolase
MVTRIRCGTLIDATGSPPRIDQVILVDGRTIKAVLDAPNIAGEAHDVIDLTGYTVLPGLIDAHDHLILDPGDEAAQCAQPAAHLALKATKNAEAILRSGITTLRDAGERYFIDVSTKRAIAEGYCKGPRLLNCGHPLVHRGGAGNFIGREVYGAQDMERAVTEQLEQGVDHIKIMVSGGFATRGSTPRSQELTTEEITSCIRLAHANGRKVMAHIHGGPGLRVALDAGVHSVEHGILFTEEEIRMIADAGRWLVFTNGIFAVAAASPDVPESVKEKLGAALDNGLAVRRWARAYGVKVAVGTDTNHGRLDMELDALIDAGWSSMEALLACTIRGAELCDLDDRIGTIEPGKVADIVAVKGNPLENARALRDVVFVMKEGQCEFAT